MSYASFNSINNSIDISYLSINKHFNFKYPSLMSLAYFADTLDEFLIKMYGLSNHGKNYLPIIETYINMAVWAYELGYAVSFRNLTESTDDYTVVDDYFKDLVKNVNGNIDDIYERILLFSWILDIEGGITIAFVEKGDSDDTSKVVYRFILNTKVPPSKISSLENNMVNLFLIHKNYFKNTCLDIDSYIKHYNYFIFGTKGIENSSDIITDILSSNAFEVPVRGINKADVSPDDALFESNDEVLSSDKPKNDTVISEDTEGTDSDYIDFNYEDSVSIPDGNVIVDSVLALVDNDTNKPVAIRCKTNFGVYDINIKVAKELGFKLSKVKKAIKVTYAGGIYASKSERKNENFVEDLSQNIKDCGRIISAIFRGNM